MKHTFIILAAMAALTAGTPAEAKCRVQYKAKMDNPLRLDVGTAELPDDACGSKAAAAAALAPKLASQGWTLLTVMSIVSGG